MGELLTGRSVDMEHERLAAVILDGMYQFVALLNTKGDILEVNRAALEGAGHRIEEIRGKPFWTARWWQVSEEIQEQLKEAIRRAAKGEFVRYEVQAYGDNAGLNEITTDFSLQPIRGESGEVEYLLPEGRNITERKQAENEVARQAEELRVLNDRLKELDRLKTQFFANVSHEFRTPLTLMLGPLENALNVMDAKLYPEVAANLASSHRNALRLLKLVNTLLDFSRIEAGRIQASYEPTDLAALTARLASVFRSAMERAGLELLIDCHPLSEAVYVDREMWEKIVLNLLSNAFKFTFEGRVMVQLREVDGCAELSVCDTGTGIPADETPRLFERFHRVKGASGRSYEGSGIGLALVQELVKLHGGAITVESEVKKGATFRIRMPFGSAHLPVEQISATRELSSTAIRSDAFVQEALRWETGDQIPSTSESLNSTRYSVKIQGVESANNSRTEPGYKVLVVDDNADMRDYMRSLLAPAYIVLTATNGEEGLKLVEVEHPDLILSDIMMPGMDGFALLHALRSNSATREIPVIFLSARAGEEETIEGRVAGADDYLIKPFSARELLARVAAHLKLAQARRDAEVEIRKSEERFRAFVSASSDVVYQMNPDWTTMQHLEGKRFISDTRSPDQSWLERYIHPEDRPLVLGAIHRAIETKSPFELEHRVLRPDGTRGWTFSRAIPLLDTNGEIKEWFGAATDITARKLAEEAVIRSQRLASVGRMAATISHEINNPLEALGNLLYLASTTEGLPSIARERLADADAELQRVAHITRQALGFYRESNAADNVDLGTLIDSVITLLRNKIKTKHVRVKKQIRGANTVTAVAGELRQVCSNLLVNSIEAVEQGGTVKISVGPCTLRNDRPGIRITFSDNGSGIEASKLPNIFEPLYTTKGEVGTGLGLWVSKQIIEKHHGRIQLRSCSAGERRGSTFSILLPR